MEFKNIAYRIGQPLRGLGAVALCALIPVASGACGDDTKAPDGSVATVTGRLEAGSASGGTAKVMTVDDDGHLMLVGSGAVAASGRYEVSNVPGGDGPFIVQITSGTQVVAEVIVPQAMDDGDRVTAMPASSETTIEAQAFLSVVAGAAKLDDVDTIGLATWVDAELAASADAGETNAATIGAAFAAAQDGYRAVAETETNAKIIVAQLQAAKLSAFTELAVALDLATNERLASEAWQAFQTSVAAKVQGELGLSSQTQSDATAAAGILFSAAFSGEAGVDADRSAALLSAHADLVAQREAVAGSSAQAAVQAELESAYSDFVVAANAATTEAQMQAAWGALTTRVTGSGQVTFGSALGILVAAEGENDVQAMEDAVNAIGATASASTALETKLDAALEGSATVRAQSVAQAYVEYRTAVASSISATNALSTRVQGFAVEAASQVGGHGAVILGIDIAGYLGGFTINGIGLSGSLLAGLGIQAGADAAFGASDFDALRGATSAALVSVAADGTLTNVSQGAITADGWSFNNVDAVGGTLLVELRDAESKVTGAVILDGNTEGDVLVPRMTEETTVEALVWLDIVRRAEAPAQIDRATLELLIDAPIAAQAHTANDVRTLALAVQAAAAVQAEGLGGNATAIHAAGMPALVALHAKLVDRGETAAAAYVAFRAELTASLRSATGASTEAYSRAQLEAAHVFAAVVEAGAGSESDLAHASAARARIEAALAFEAATSTAFDGSAFSDSEAAVALAVEAFISASHTAESQAQLDTAATVFVDAMVDTQDTGSVLGRVAAQLVLVPTVVTTLNGVIDASFVAGGAFKTAIGAAVSGAAGGQLDADGVATANAGASQTFDAAIVVDALLWSGPDNSALRTVLTYLALGFQGAN